MKTYNYIGPCSLLKRVAGQYSGKSIKNIGDIEDWIHQNNLSADTIIVTYIINISGSLVISERQREHVQCAQGEKVSGAGELTFDMTHGEMFISDISNQSTGYCPEPESWEAVQQALDLIRIEHPDYFTAEFNFRRCEGCKMINIIKDNYYYCTNCENQLSREWNID